jgi:dCMP deaminase
MNMSRPSKDEYYLDIAKSVSRRSPCTRVKYGAIIVKNDAIVSTGYNGPIRGGVNCYEVGGCIKDILDLPHGRSYDLCPAVHAEENCVVNSARNGTSVLDGVLYLYGIDPKTGKTVYSEPCDRCKRAIINAGIRMVVTIKEDGSIQRFNVVDWIKQDTEKYLDNLKKAKHGIIK